MPNNNEVIQAALWSQRRRGWPEPIKDLWVSGEFMMRLRLQQLQLGSLWDGDFCPSAEGEEGGNGAERPCGLEGEPL